MVGNGIGIGIAININGFIHVDTQVNLVRLRSMGTRS